MGIVQHLLTPDAMTGAKSIPIWSHAGPVDVIDVIPLMLHELGKTSTSLDVGLWLGEMVAMASLNRGSRIRNTEFWVGVLLLIDGTVATLIFAFGLCRIGIAKMDVRRSLGDVKTLWVFAFRDDFIIFTLSNLHILNVLPDIRLISLYIVSTISAERESPAAAGGSPRTPPSRARLPDDTNKV